MSSLNYNDNIICNCILVVRCVVGAKDGRVSANCFSKNGNPIIHRTCTVEGGDTIIMSVIVPCKLNFTELCTASDQYHVNVTLIFITQSHRQQYGHICDNYKRLPTWRLYCHFQLYRYLWTDLPSNG